MPVYDDRIEDQLDGPTVRVTALAVFNFRSGVKRLWSGFGNLPIGSDIYEGIGKMGQLSSVTAGPGGAVEEMTFSLFGDAPMLAHIKEDQQESEGQEVQLYEQFFDIRKTDEAGHWVDWSPIGDPDALFWGRMGPLKIQRVSPSDSQPATRIISVSAQGILVNRARPVAAYFSDRDQRSRSWDGEDAFCVRIPQYSNATVKWPTF